MMKQMNMDFRSFRSMACGLLLSLCAAGCGEYEVISASAAAIEVAAPDLIFGKADQSSNTKLGRRLDAGMAASGTVTGFTALPVTLTRDEILEAQTWTERPAVIMVYGPRIGADWDFKRVQAATRDIKPGVHSEYLQYVAPESGEYLVVVGNGDDLPNRWILARAGRMEAE